MSRTRNTKKGNKQRIEFLRVMKADWPNTNKEIREKLLDKDVVDFFAVVPEFGVNTKDLEAAMVNVLAAVKRGDIDVNVAVEMVKAIR